MNDQTEELAHALLLAFEKKDEALLQPLLPGKKDILAVISTQISNPIKQAQALTKAVAKQSKVTTNQLASFREACETIHGTDIRWDESFFDEVALNAEENRGIKNHRLSFSFGDKKWRFSISIQSVYHVEGKFKLFAPIQCFVNRLDSRNPSPKSILQGQFEVITWAEFRRLSQFAKTSIYFEDKYKQGNVALARGNVVVANLDLDSPFFDCDTIAVDGHLAADSITNYNTNTGSLLYIANGLQAKFLIAGGSEIRVKGTATVEGAVFAHGNDGVLILDKIITDVLVDDDHHTEIKDETAIECCYRIDENYSEMKSFLKQLKSDNSKREMSEIARIIYE